MVNSFNDPGDFRIEISGWGLDNTFFVERTCLLWTSEGTKQVQLHRALPEGAMVFIRLLATEPSNGSVPVAYQVQEVGPMDCSGRCRMRLAQMHPRSKESLERKNASNCSEDSKRVRDVREQKIAEELQYEEVLQ
jgi:hypothetical protein